MGDWSCFRTQWGEQVQRRVLQSIPMANRLPESIIQYVIGLMKVILNDAPVKAINIIQHHQTQSSLCLPLLNPGDKPAGVLYLENQVATGAFVPSLTSSNLLSTQAAIATKMPNFIQKLRASESQMSISVVPVELQQWDVTSRLTISINGNSASGQRTDPSVTLSKFASAYQLIVSGNRSTISHWRTAHYPALSGERTIDDLEIHQTAANSSEVGTPIWWAGQCRLCAGSLQDITERR